MKSISSCLLFGLLFDLLAGALPLNTYAAPVEPCSVVGTKSATTTVYCTRGEGTVEIDPETHTEMESEVAYHLVFGKTLFNKVRTVSIKDATTQTLALTIEIKEDQAATIRSNDPGNAWILEGLGEASLNSLEIAIDGAVFVKDALELNSRLEVRTDMLYWLNPFSIKNGSFLLRYEEGVLPGLNFRFQSRFENNATIIESLGTISNPSKRRVSLKDFETFDISPPLEDLVAAYTAAHERTVLEDYPRYKDERTEQAKKDFLRFQVFPKIEDNKKKGVIGESLYRSFMARKYPSYQYYDPKVGLNSFDAVFVAREDANLRGSPVAHILISEVKYANHGKPVLGVRKINDKEWRQLSRPYIESVLTDLENFSDDTRTLAALIRTNQNKVKLRLVVFDPETFQMLVYRVGTMDNALLN